MVVKQCVYTKWTCDFSPPHTCVAQLRSRHKEVSVDKLLCFERMCHMYSSNKPKHTLWKLLVIVLIKSKQRHVHDCWFHGATLSHGVRTIQWLRPAHSFEQCRHGDFIWVASCLVPVSRCIYSWAGAAQGIHADARWWPLPGGRRHFLFVSEVLHLALDNYYLHHFQSIRDHSGAA